MSFISQEKIPSNANELASQSTQQPQLVCTWSAPAPRSGSSQSALLRCRHTLTATANAASELFLFGGYGDVEAKANSDVYVFSTRDFSVTLLQTSGEVPTPRFAHCSVLIGTTLLIWGGLNNSGNINDDSLHLLNLETREWSHVVVNGPGPGGRFDHTANVVGSKLFIFGGWDGQKAFDDMWTLDLNGLTSQPVWESYEPTPGNEKPLPRYGHVSVTTGDHIIIFGGCTQHKVYSNDTWSFDISTRKWTKLQCTGSIPSPRICHAPVLVDGVMYVFGGYTGKNCLDDLIALQLSTQRWFNFHNVGQSPHGKCFHAMASDGTHVFVHGGFSPGKFFAELRVFDTKDIKYPEPERNEKTTQLPQMRNSSTGPSTQVQPQHPTPSSSNAHSASCHGMQKASPALSGRPASSQITREQNPGPNDRSLERAVVRDPEDGVFGGSMEHHAKFSAPYSSSEGVARLELERQLSVSLSVQTEQGQRIARLADELTVKSALPEQAEANPAEGKRRAILDLVRELEDRLLAQTSLVKQRDAELVDTRSKLRNAEAKLDESLLSLSQQIVRYAAELANVCAELEAKKSELEAVRLRPTDAGDGWARSKTRAGKLRTVTAASLIDLNEDRDECDPKEDKQVMEAGLASPQWNEKNRDG